jgi:hypothetical protein
MADQTVGGAAATATQRDEILAAARDGDVTKLESRLEYLDSKKIDISQLVEESINQALTVKKWGVVSYLAGYLNDIASGETSGGAGHSPPRDDAGSLTDFIVETPGKNKEDAESLADFIVETKIPPIVINVPLVPDETHPAPIDEGELVLPERTAQIEISFPLKTPEIFSIQPPGGLGFTKADLAAAILKLYQKIYQEEEETSTVDVATIPGMSHRNRTNGKHGIWGYFIDDLWLENVAYDATRRLHIPAVRAS